MSDIDLDAELKARTAEIKERFAAESVEGTVTVRHDDGLYRHVEVSLPKHRSFRCEVMTWPGALAVTGGSGSYIFRREDDMIAFFRECQAQGVSWDVDTRYWAEKLQPDGDRSILSFAKDRVRAYIKQAAAEGEAEHPGLAKEVEEELFSRYSDADLETEAGTKAALAAFEFDGFRFDTQYWEFTEYGYWFIYTCQVLAWTVAQYDTAQVPVG